LSEFPGGIIEVQVQCFGIAIDENGYCTLIANNFSSRSERHGRNQNTVTWLQTECFYGKVQRGGAGIDANGMSATNGFCKLALELSDLWTGG
jgi:hypothetical protein